MLHFRMYNILKFTQKSLAVLIPYLLAYSQQCFVTALLTSYHRLNGSSSPVLTATPHFYGKGQISTPPHKIKTSERIGMKFGTVDYVLEINPQNKFGDDRSSGGFWVNM